MKLKVISEKEMPLLDRRLITLEAESKGVTPKKDDVKREIVSLLKTDEKLVKIKKILPNYGGEKLDIKAYVYKTEEALKTFEQKKKDGKEKSQEQKKQ